MPNWWSTALIVLTVFAMVTPTTRALSQPSPQVAVVVQQDAELEARLRDELDTTGFLTIALLPEDAERTARPGLEADVAVVLWATSRDGGYELWLRDRATGDTVIREVVASRDVSAVALRAVELVRVAMLERKTPKPQLEQPKPDAEPQAPSPPISPPRPPEMPRALSNPAPPVMPVWRPTPRNGSKGQPPTVFGSVELSAIWFHDASGGDSSAGIEASGGLFYPRLVQTRLRARYLLYMPSLPVGESGTMDTRSAQAGVAMAFHSVDPTANISPFLEVGADLLWLQTRGTLAPGWFQTMSPRTPLFLGTPDDSFRFYPHVGVGLSLGIAPFPIRVRTQLAVGVAVPAQRLYLAHQSRTWARSIVEGTLGLQYLIR